MVGDARVVDQAVDGAQPRLQHDQRGIDLRRVGQVCLGLGQTHPSGGEFGQGVGGYRQQVEQADAVAGARQAQCDASAQAASGAGDQDVAG